LNAVLVSLIVTILLSLINIGSTTALNGILSLTTSSLLTSYIITISCVLIKRFRGHTLPPSRWSLGKFGIPLNIGALCFLLPIYMFAFFPTILPVQAVNMNWGCVMYGGMILFATGYYAVWGRKEYVPPVARVRRDI